MQRRVVALFLLTCAFGLVWAEVAEAGRSPVYAVLIGINRYKDRNITPLKFTRRDVRGLYKTLTGVGRVPKKNVRILLNRNATKAKIASTLRSWLYRKMKRSRGRATAFIYFSGHGWSGGNGISYWLAYDSKAKSPKHIQRSAIDHESVDSWLTRLRSKRVVLFVDACNSGFAWSGGTRSMHMSKKGFHRAIPANVFGQGRVTIASSMQNQYSIESKKLKHGIFSYVLIDALRGKADYNKDGVVTLPEVWTHLSSNVRRIAMVLKNYPQSPVRSGPSTGAIPLSFPRVQGGTSGARGLTVIKAAKDNLSVSSRPPGATVFVDGADTGQTPTGLRLSPGFHRLVVKKRGYATWRGKVYVRRNGLLRKRVRLRPIRRVARRTKRRVRRPRRVVRRPRVKRISLRTMCRRTFAHAMRCQGRQVSLSQLSPSQQQQFYAICQREFRADPVKLTQACANCLLSQGCVKDEVLKRICRRQCY